MSRSLKPVIISGTRSSIERGARGKTNRGVVVSRVDTKDAVYRKRAKELVGTES